MAEDVGFNSIGPFLQSVSARLESVRAAEMRAGTETVGGTRRNKGEEKREGNKTQTSGGRER